MKLISLISGGFDSSVASYLMLKHENKLIFVHFEIHQNNETPILKTKKSIQEIKKYLSIKTKLILFIIPHTNILNEIKHKCNIKNLCVLCKRAMMRISCEIAKNNKIDALLTGDCLGQVASQTLDNIYTINKSVSIPIIRPLIGMNKQDIIKISKKIGTHNTNIIQNKEFSCNPKHCITHSNFEIIEKEEQKINFEKLEQSAIINAREILV